MWDTWLREVWDKLFYPPDAVKNAIHQTTRYLFSVLKTSMTLLPLSCQTHISVLCSFKKIRVRLWFLKPIFWKNLRCTVQILILVEPPALKFDFTSEGVKWLLRNLLNSWQSTVHPTHFQGQTDVVNWIFFRNSHTHRAPMQCLSVKSELHFFLWNPIISGVLPTNYMLLYSHTVVSLTVVHK